MLAFVSLFVRFSSCNAMYTVCLTYVKKHDISTSRNEEQPEEDMLTEAQMKRMSREKLAEYCSKELRMSELNCFNERRGGPLSKEVLIEGAKRKQAYLHQERP